MPPEQAPEMLALHGGSPVRERLLPYGRQTIGDDDVQAVVDVLRSEWLTTGPQVGAFEEAFTAFTGSAHAVAVSNGTAALHAAMYALGIGPGDEVIVPAMTFAASSNSVVYAGGTPVFADVDVGTLLIDPSDVAAKITPRTKAIVAVDYAGQPCDYRALREVANRHGLSIVADACHAIGGADHGRAVGTLADLSTFSFHPVKHVTTGEGGMITTHSPELARRMRTFRNHGITTDHRQRSEQGAWFYEMVDMGYNYRLADFQCVLGQSQLRKLPGWIECRREIAQQYDAALPGVPGVTPLAVRAGAEHAYHLYVVQLDPEAFGCDRDTAFPALRAEGIGVNVHYIPVYLHPFYRDRFGMQPGLCPVAEAAYRQVVSLPMFPVMTAADVDDVVAALGKVGRAYRPAGQGAAAGA